ncbi:hypothetical protein KQX54_012331, partial [Cotesia glomerata]
MAANSIHEFVCWIFRSANVIRRASIVSSHSGAFKVLNRELLVPARQVRVRIPV